MGPTTEPHVLLVRSDGRKKYHTTNPDGSEQVDEYDEKTNELLLRKTRRPKLFGGDSPWEIEVGMEERRQFDPSADVLGVSNTNPIFMRKDTDDMFQWRIRNLHYPKDTYGISVDDETQQIVIRTSNKKYFKRIDIPDMRRLELKLDRSCVTWEHKHNTLIVSYPKPEQVIIADLRRQQLGDRMAMKI
eukprot:GEMP01062186.1.p1 GENE.GEMP01062186.1~~GEMP01062186.1.p1  ORF type:complete len:198 (+),score=29.12 GEMP01062186.1:32-595(+)